MCVWRGAIPNMIYKQNLELWVLKLLVIRNWKDIPRENDYIHVLFLGFFSEVSTTGCHQKQDIKLGRYLIWLNHSYYTYMQCQEWCSHFLYSKSVRYVPHYSASTLGRVAKPWNNTKKPKEIFESLCVPRVSNYRFVFLSIEDSVLL